MMRLLFFLFLFGSYSVMTNAQGIPRYTADMLMKRAAHKDSTYIINFWASWCGPCVKELPEFTKLQERYAGKPVKVLLVSFDFPDSYPDKLEAYVSRKKIVPEVVWFGETNATEFIPKIHSEWSGGLPGTMIVNSKATFKVFLEKMVTEEEIGTIVDGLIRR